MSGPEPTRRLPHWPAFDGVRALAVLAVMSFHVDYPTVFKGGYTGVDVFFVLSGFLITSLLVTEHGNNSSISFRKFYARRALRLFPALAVLIIVTVILVLTDGGLTSFRHLTLTGLPFVVLYSGNWAIAYGNVLTLGLLSITWTLAIEEQYYLLWPLGLSALLRRMDRQRIAFLLIAATAVEMIVRLVLSYMNVSGSWLQKSTLTHSDGLLLGSALALLWSLGNEWKVWPAVAKRANVFGLVGAAGLAVVLFAGNPDTTHKVSFWVSVAVLSTVALLICLLAEPTGWMSRTFSLAPLQWIGKRSYGCYLWHFLIIALIPLSKLPTRHEHFTQFLLVFAGTFLIAGLSYRFIEQPFLRRKSRFTVVSHDVNATT